MPINEEKHVVPSILVLVSCYVTKMYAHGYFVKRGVEFHIRAASVLHSAHLQTQLLVNEVTSKEMMH